MCDNKPEAIATCAVVLLMAQGEYYKPSNTGRLIADVVPENYAFNGTARRRNLNYWLYCLILRTTRT